MRVRDMKRKGTRASEKETREADETRVADETREADETRDAIERMCGLAWAWNMLSRLARTPDGLFTLERDLVKRDCSYVGGLPT